MLTRPIFGVASPGFAQHLDAGLRVRPRAPVAVPEIDASSGLLAVAAVATILLFVWDRDRKNKGT
jgi:hypothetical protein